MADDKKEDEVDALVKAAVKQIVAKYFAGFILFLGAAGSTLVGTGGLERAARPDPFTALDGDLLEAEIGDVDVRLRNLEAAITVEQRECQIWRENLAESIDNKDKALEWQIRRDMPPAATKARIRACERWIEKQDTGWEPPTLEWQ